MIEVPKFVRVVSVDHYGFNGRDHHPEDTDIGHVMRINTIEWEPSEEIPGYDEPLAVFHCTRRDGSLVQLMDFEVEVVQIMKLRLVFKSPEIRVDTKPLPIGASVEITVDLIGQPIGRDELGRLFELEHAFNELTKGRLHVHVES